LEQWKEGGLLYQNAVYQARLADRTSTIAGVLWHQGEADCGEGLRDTYAFRFEKIMQALRRDLNLYDVPFVLGALGDFLADCTEGPSLKYYETINSQLKLVAKRNQRTVFVPADGLTGKEDNVHFNAKSLYEFGLRYFESFEKVRDEKKVFVEKSEEDTVRSAMEKL
jgi:hypothetical protein